MSAIAGFVFDLYGTLLDYRSLPAAIDLVPEPQRVAFVELWRRKQIDYALLSSQMDRYRDFNDLTRRALAYVCASFGVDASPERHAATAALWGKLPAHPDAAGALRALRTLGAPVVVLTNGVAASARAVLANAGLGELVDDVLSVESVRTYKPHPSVYQLAVERLGPAERIVFFSSNGWDASGAAAFGFRVVWCNRTGEPHEQLGFEPERIVGSLEEASRSFAASPA